MATLLSEVQLLPVLQGTLSNSPDERFQAEAVLAEREFAQYSKLEGYCLSLLKIAAAEQVVDVSVRQASAICLKNTVKKRWSISIHTPEESRKPGEFPIHASDKANLMSSLQECVIRHASTLDLVNFETLALALSSQSSPLVRTQLLECVREVVSQDYPQPWSSLVPEIVVNLKSEDAPRIYGALLVLRTVARRLEFTHEMRSVMEDFAAAALPVLLPLFQGLLAETSVVDELAMMMKTVLKVFWSCIYVDVPCILVDDPAQCRGWLEAILTLMKRPVPADVQPQDPVERQKSPWWKLKKWAMSIASRLFERYGDPRITVSEPAKALSLVFKANCATAYLLVRRHAMQGSGYLVYLPSV